MGNVEQGPPADLSSRCRACRLPREGRSFRELHTQVDRLSLVDCSPFRHGLAAFAAVATGTRQSPRQ